MGKLNLHQFTPNVVKSQNEGNQTLMTPVKKNTLIPDNPMGCKELLD